MIDMIQGGLVLSGAAVIVQWKLTGVSPVKRLGRGTDAVRAAGFLVVRIGREVGYLARRDWEACLAKARRER